MDKNKSEKLKEVLNQTLSAEEIEVKLKQSTLKKEGDRQPQKKEELNEKKEEVVKNLETPMERDIHIKEEPYITKQQKKNPLEEDIVIPTVRNKKKENKSILSYFMIIIFLLLPVAIYLLYTKDSVKEKSQKNIVLQEKEIKEKTSINNEKNIKEEPLTVYNNLEEKKVLEEEKLQLKIENKEKVEKEKPQIKESIKEKIVIKELKLNRQSFKKYYNSSKYNTLKCYNFKVGNIFPDNSCKIGLKKFLKANKNAIRFEVIPVIGQNDNQIFIKMRESLKDMDEIFQEKVRKYMLRGLSRERVLEVSWHIKDILGEDTILTPTNYYVKSRKNSKGVIVRAYH